MVNTENDFKFENFTNTENDFMVQLPVHSFQSSFLGMLKSNSSI